MLLETILLVSYGQSRYYKESISFCIKSSQIKQRSLSGNGRDIVMSRDPNVIPSRRLRHSCCCFGCGLLNLCCEFQRQNVITKSWQASNGH
jgi:hypothetical protein